MAELMMNPGALAQFMTVGIPKGKTNEFVSSMMKLMDAPTRSAFIQSFTGPAAAKEVGAHDFIMNLPGGYQYNVGERGGVLSVGQKQLISFIRAFVYNPKILILDEATASVDSESEELIQNATKELQKGRTSIVIAHRLSTIINSSQILVIDDGKILESGNHESLLALNGHYKKLYDLNFTKL
jgi:ATP-binding cassette subfamily B protein